MFYMLTMDYAFAVFSFVVLIVKCNADKLSAAELKYDFAISLFSSTAEQVVHYTANVNKPLELHFQNMFIFNGWCMDFYDPAKTLEATVGNSMIYIRKVTYSMSTLWKCQLMEIDMRSFGLKKNLLPKYYFLFINIHVKGAKSVEISVNEKDVTFSEADLSDAYDGTSVYLYEDGEHVKVVCRNPHSTGTVHLEYFTDTRNVSESAGLDIQLHSGSNHSYINCVYVTTEPADRYVYRVTFVIKKPSSFYSKDIKSLSEKNMCSLALLGSFIGAVIVVLAVTGAAYNYCVRTRKARHTEIPNGQLTNKSDSSTSQTNEYENQLNLCYETSGSMGPEEHFYTKIDYKPKICGTQTRKSLVYDEPYVHRTLTNATYVNITTSFKV